MYRLCMPFLNDWLTSSSRKPLVIRGARQVGKTWVVRHLAEIHSKKLIEVNFETMPAVHPLFNSNDPQQILLGLSIALNLGSINPEESILFLDEIQAFPEIFAKLRWFYENMPALPVIATGSLLEFLLDNYPFSVPVGRINYMYLEPFSFEEFLIASNKSMTVDYLKNFTLGDDIPIVLHDQWMELFKEYMIVGGLPEAVKEWVTNRSPGKLAIVHHDLLTTYRDDFNRYKGRLDIQRLEDVMMAIPRMLGKKFVYKKVNPDVQIPALKQALNLLSKARLCTEIRGTAANGMPLGAEIQNKFLKVIFLDVGLCSTALDLTLNDLKNITEIDLINSGGIAEQVVGQLLRTTRDFFIKPELYYWQREEKDAKAEVDYVIAHAGKIIPIEVKAGSTGGLKSLHVFMGLKNYNRAIRINSDFPQLTEVAVKDYQGNLISYKLLSIPFYMIEQIHRLINQI